MSNGVEFFLGGVTDTTDYTGDYGTDFWVETSPLPTDGSWTLAVEGVDVDITGDVITFTADTANFARLAVTDPN